MAGIGIERHQRWVVCHCQLPRSSYIVQHGGLAAAFGCQAIVMGQSLLLSHNGSVDDRVRCDVPLAVTIQRLNDLPELRPTLSCIDRSHSMRLVLLCAVFHALMSV